MFKIYKRPPITTPEPKNSGWILLSWVVLIGLMPISISISMAAGGVSSHGPDLWADNFVGIWLFTLLFGGPPLIAYKNYRSTWAIVWLWVGGLIMTIAYLPGLALAAATFVGWLKPTTANDIPFFRYFAFGAMLFCLPWYYFIFRMLTMRYFQPWTTPDQWETEVYRPPAWADAIARNAFWLIALILVLRGCAAMLGSR